jgi:hypothetical protein
MAAPAIRPAMNKSDKKCLPRVRTVCLRLG